MEYELNNINKIDSYVDKVKVIQNLIDKKDFDNALKATRALIEATGIVVLRKKYNVTPKNSQLSMISFTLIENGDEFLGEWFKSLNGTLSYTYENCEIDEEIVVNNLLELDELVGIVLKKYDGILN